MGTTVKPSKYCPYHIQETGYMSAKTERNGKGGTPNLFKNVIKNTK